MIKLIKEYKEGLKIYKCDCGHHFSVPKNKQEIKCFYCGQVKLDNKDIPLPIA